MKETIAVVFIISGIVIAGVWLTFVFEGLGHMIRGKKDD